MTIIYEFKSNEEIYILTNESITTKVSLLFTQQTFQTVLTIVICDSKLVTSVPYKSVKYLIGILI